MEPERRKHRRLGVRLPARVQGWAPNGSPWPEAEVSNCIDVGFGGVAIAVRRPLVLGQVLRMSMSFPKNLRAYDLEEPSYIIFGIVRYTSPSRVGVMFLGKQPPKGFAEHPGELFLLPGDESPVRRYHRFPVTATVKLHWVEAPSGVRADEVTITEDVSEGGMMVRTTLPLKRGNTVELEGVDGPFQARAAVRLVLVGEDKVPRAGLMFTSPDATESARTWMRRHGLVLGVRVTEVSTPTPPRDASPPPAEPEPVSAGPSVALLFETFSTCTEQRHAECAAIFPMPALRRVKLCECRCHRTR